MKRIILAIAAIIFLLILIAALWGYFAFLSTKPLTKEELAELTPDWSVITHDNWSPWFVDAEGTGSPKTTWNPAASFNAWLDTVPEQDKAWPIFVEIRYQYPALYDVDDFQRYISDVTDLDRLLANMQVDENAQAIQEIIEALSKPIMGRGFYESIDPYEHNAMKRFGVEDQDWIADQVFIPDLESYFTNDVWRSVKLVLLHASSELIQGNTDQFVEELVIALNATRLAIEFHAIPNQLFVNSIVNEYCSTLIWSLEHHPEKFTVAQLSTLRSAIEQRIGSKFIWQGHALLSHDLIRRFAGTDGASSIHSAANKAGAIASTHTYTNLPDQELHKSSQRLLYINNELIKETANQSQIPWDGSRGGIADLHEQYKSTISLLSAKFLDGSFQTLDKVAIDFRKRAQQEIALTLIIAIHQHKIIHGSFPVSIEEIDTEFQPSQVMDIFTGNQLQYRLTDSGPLIYALGPDRDDDIGTHVFGIAHVSSKTDGDWVLFPTPIYPDDD